MAHLVTLTLLDTGPFVASGTIALVCRIANLLDLSTGRIGEGRGYSEHVAQRSSGHL